MEGLGLIIGALATLITAILGWVKYLSSKKREEESENMRLQAENEMRFQRAALEFPDFIEEWSHISDDVVNLISETEIDRFLILRAWNGHLEPRWTTAVYQIRETGQKPIAYVHFELDKDYVSRLREISIANTMFFETDHIPESVIKDVYKVEGITSALWAHLHSTATLEGGQAHTYCSFATHEGKISLETQTRCRILTGRLKGIAMAFEKKH